MRSALKQDHIVVVGGSKGIGRAFVLLAASSQTRITVISRNPPEAGLSWPQSVAFEQADALDAESLDKALYRAVEARGKISGLAFFQRHRGKEGSWEGNLASSLTLTRMVIEHAKGLFVEAGDKSIVMLASSASRAVADEQDEGYHVAKAGMLGLCRYYAYKLGALGIRVNCVSPGTLLKEGSRKYFLENKALHDLYCKVSALKRMGTAEEVAAVVQFLLSPAGSFITGQEITVDGGAGLQWQESLARSLINTDQ